uniref:Growth arrest and DNA-damage-inducible, gamma b, tandem duplicate 1 n=1 Tax=Cyprinus carpio carpio TaxID=630221 RepID=A0A9J8D4L3_CYPCA
MCEYAVHCFFLHATAFIKLFSTDLAVQVVLIICLSLYFSDPDSVSFCVLAMDEVFECDIALQIHFTLIQAFCFDNDISIVSVNDMQRLSEIVGDNAEQFEDAHCVLITKPAEDSWEDPALEKLHLFCEESRSYNEWVPEITLPER